MESNPFVVRAHRERRWLLLALFGCNLVAIAVFSSLRITPSANGVLCFDLELAPFTWGTALLALVVLALQNLVSVALILGALRSDDSRRVAPPQADVSDADREIAALVEEVAADCGIPAIDEVYFLRQPVPNAFTARLLGIGNIVALHSNLFDFLSPAGVRAVIAHELAHIKHGDSLMRQLVAAPAAHVFVIVGWGLWRVLGGVFSPGSLSVFLWRMLFLVLYLIIAFVVLGVLGSLATAAARRAELLADGFAGRTCGWIPTANMLLLLGERTEALEALVEVYEELIKREGDDRAGANEAELRRILARFPRTELNDEVARQLVPELLIRERLEALQKHYCVPFGEEDLARLSREGGAALRARLAEEKAAKADDPGAEAPAPDGDASAQPTEAEAQAEPLVDWRSYDFDLSGHLDAEELRALLAKLRDEPERMLFHHFLAPESRTRDHPPIRERLLFVADVLAEDARSASR